MNTMRWWVNDDGGRASAGFKGKTNDCVVRAIAIAGRLDYRWVYDELHAEALERRAKTRLSERRAAKRYSSPRDGVHKDIYRPFMERLGATWTPTMEIGSGCKVHVHPDELPYPGRHVLRVSRHLVAYVDGMLHDTHDPSRFGTRCVYGYWTFPDNDLPRALAERWCNGCGQPASTWAPVCPGMTVGDYTHYHSPEWWRSKLGGES